MKNFLKLLCAIALVAVTVFSMAACGEDGGGTGGTGDSGGSGVEKISLTNVTVTVKTGPNTNNFVMLDPGSGRVNLTDVITGTPKAQMTNSKLTLELDKPKGTAMVTLSSHLPGITVTPATVKYYRIVEFWTSSTGGNNLYIEGPSTNYLLMYVDNDVTINGADSELSFTNVKLKEGWNYLSVTGTTEPYTCTASQTLPGTAQWVASN